MISVRTAKPGQRTVIAVVVVKLFELELTPDQAIANGFAQNEVDVTNKGVYGVGIVTCVAYGGFLVVETTQGNYDALHEEFKLLGGVKVGPGGGYVGAGVPGWWRLRAYARKMSTYLTPPPFATLAEI